MTRSLHLALTCAALGTLASDVLLAQEALPPYVTSSTIEAAPLDEARTKALTEFLAQPLKYQKRTRITSLLCKPIITQPTPHPDQLKLPLALVETEVTAEITFEKKAAGDQAGSVTNSFSIDFDQGFITIRASRPRYQSQVGGIRAAYPQETTTGVFLEGKEDTDLVFLVPPVADCGLQFVVACPRNYSNTRTLEESPLAPVGVRLFATAKADGLFKAPQGAEGKVLSSLRASSRIPLPSPWYTENVSVDTPASVIRLQPAIDARLRDASTYPVNDSFADALEARLEFGTKDSVLRTVSSISTFDVRPFKLETQQTVRVENADVPLSPGSCFVISHRKETHY